MKHYGLIKIIQSYLANSTALKAKLLNAGEKLLIQIGENMDNPIKEEQAPAIIITSLGSVQGKTDKITSHNILLSISFINKKETETIYNDVTFIENEAIKKSDEIINIIVKELKKFLLTFQLEISNVDREIDTQYSLPFITSTINLTIDDVASFASKNCGWGVLEYKEDLGLLCCNVSTPFNFKVIKIDEADIVYNLGITIDYGNCSLTQSKTLTDEITINTCFIPNACKLIKVNVTDNTFTRDLKTVYSF